MSENKKNKELDAITVILTVIGVVLIFGILLKIFKDLKENTGSDIVSEEGQEILGDPDKREKLRKAVEHYHEKGNWDLLSNVSKETV